MKKSQPHRSPVTQKPSQAKSVQNEKRNRPQSSATDVSTHGFENPENLSVGAVDFLSRKLGNRATHRLLQRRNVEPITPERRPPLMRKFEGDLAAYKDNKAIIEALYAIYGTEITIRPFQVQDAKTNQDNTYRTLADLAVKFGLKPKGGGGDTPPTGPSKSGVKPQIGGGGIKPPASGTGKPAVNGGTKPPENDVSGSKPLSKGDPVVAVNSSGGGTATPVDKSASTDAPKVEASAQAQTVANPELLAKHQGSKLFVAAGKAFATITNGQIGEPRTTFDGGATEVKRLQANVARKWWELPAGKSVHGFEGGAVTDGTFSYGAAIKVEVVQRNVSKGKQSGTVWQYGSTKFWSPDGVQEKSEMGSTVSYNNTTYWVPEAHLVEAKAGWAKKDTPLFVPSPKPEHVLQGALGDCYLMAALSSIVTEDSGFPQKLMTDNGDGTVTVKLYAVSDSSESYYTTGANKGGYASSGKFAATPKPVKVEKSVPEMQGEALYAQGHLWVQMVEKAYAAGGFPKGLLAKSGTYGDISGGKSKKAFEIFLGKEASLTSLEHRMTRDGDPKTDLLKEMKAALDKDIAVAAGTRSFTADEKRLAKAEGAGHSAGESKLNGIVSDHAYSVIEVNVQAKTLKLRNPWGKYGRTLGGAKAEDNGGIVHINIDDFVKWYADVSYAGQVKEINAN